MLIRCWGGGVGPNPQFLVIVIVAKKPVLTSEMPKKSKCHRNDKDSQKQPGEAKRSKKWLKAGGNS